MTDVGTLPVEEQMAEYLTIMHRAFSSMFNVPLNKDIYGFSKIWLDLPENARKNKSGTALNVLSNGGVVQIGRMSITPVGSAMFDSEIWAGTESATETETNLDSVFYFDTPYTYGELLTALYFANNKLHTLASGMPVANAKDLIEICDTFAAVFHILRPDVVSKMITAEDFNQIAHAAMVLDAFVDHAEEEEEGEEE